MRRSRVPVIVLALAGAFVLLALWLIANSPGAENAREAERRRAELAEADGVVAQGLPSLSVDAFTASPVEARTVVDVAGELEAVREVEIGAEIGGRVVSIDALEHTEVEADQLLVTLDQELPRAAVARTAAALKSAQARQELAAAELRRREELSAQGVSSTAELDRARSEARTAEAAVAEARAALLDTETRLAKTAIRAPFAGVVSELDLEPGAYLRPGDRVGVLTNLSEIEIEVGVSDQEILAIRDGDTAEVTVEAYPGQRFEGRVVRPGRTADALTRQYPVPVRLPNPEELLLPGMLGTVRFRLGDAAPSLRIPRRAVQREFDLEYLYVLQPGGDGTALASRRSVKTRPVPFHPELLEMDSGLEAGERVAISAVRELRDGQRVRLRGERAGVAAAGGGDLAP